MRLPMSRLGRVAPVMLVLALVPVGRPIGMPMASCPQCVLPGAARCQQATLTSLPTAIESPSSRALRRLLKLADQPDGVGVSARRGWSTHGPDAMMCPGGSCRGFAGRLDTSNGAKRRRGGAVSDPWTLGGPGRPASGRAGTAKTARPARRAARARQPGSRAGPADRGAVGRAATPTGDRLAADLHLEPAPGAGARSPGADPAAGAGHPATRLPAGGGARGA